MTVGYRATYETDKRSGIRPRTPRKPATARDVLPRELLLRAEADRM